MNSIILAKDGCTAFKLVVPENPSPAIAFAAKEFAAIFSQITGAGLPERTDAQPVYEREIVIGRGAHPCLREEAIDFDALGDEGYAIYACEKQLYIAGAGDRGTLYGVYSFFEDYAGCRWFTEKLSRIPQRGCLAVPFIDKQFCPVFSYRKSAFIDSDAWQFSLRNKLNSKLRPDSVAEHGYEVTYAVGFCHTMETLVPEELYEAHPEYFAMNEKGERIHGPHTQRCLTNPDVLAMSIEKVREGFRKDPNALIASVTQADTYPDKPNNCQCPACKAIDEAEGSPVGSFLRYVNAIAEAVEEEFPGRYIDTFAYRYTRTPPKLTHPRDNVIVRLCSIECCFSHSLEACPGAYASDGIGVVDTPSFVRDIKGWAAIAPNLHIWDYVVNFVHYLAPHANIHVFKDNMQFFKAHNVIGVYPEGAPDVTGSDMAELKAYLLAKLQWDPDYDVEAGTAEFVRAYCGAGAEPILAYIRELNAKPEREGLHMCCYEKPTRAFFTPEFMEFAEACFDKAETLAENDEVLDRIRYWRMSLRYIRLWLYADTFTETALMAEFASFFADMKRYGIKALNEGGTYDKSLLRMKERIEEQLNKG